MASTANVEQAPQAAITYVQLTGLSHTFTVPAGQTWKVYASSHGEAFNVGSFRDCVAQYEFFVDGTASGIFQRTFIADFSTELNFSYGVWSIGMAQTFTAGTHTISVRGAHAGPTGTGTNIRLCSGAGSIGQSFLQIIIVQ